MITSSGECIDRLPVLIKRETQDLSVRKAYDAIFWNLPEKYVWKETPPKPESLRNYEAHHLGYNAIQLMTVMENASFSYRVTNIFAISSRYVIDTPE
ncbi:hypothetical protein Glove_330g128 [Diversispora epigaea]|uniref:Uncharacterized protein n=1 Tax=Diversispora epigaea TaxID=1348612 RepID=A0A397HJJ2_9GLOM|nr:hypothetical protein Glove_330g128 [Diversispora epigaea]